MPLCAWCKTREASDLFCGNTCRVASHREKKRTPYLAHVTPALVTTTAATVAALYVRPDGPYAEMQGVDLWPESRDATRYCGPWPIVAHPPCAPWGAYSAICPTRQRADLAVRAVDQVRWHGGVLEHPANSKLFAARGMPAPGEPPDRWGGWSILIRQSWFGHTAPKPTWLYIVGCSPERVPTLLAPLPNPGGKIVEMSRKNRELTPNALAVWLVRLARMCRPPRYARRPPGGATFERVTAGGATPAHVMPGIVTDVRETSGVVTHVAETPLQAL